MNEWEIWLSKVSFEENPNAIKKRPVLILQNNTAIFISAKITSHAPRNDFPGEYKIIEWETAGLKKESTIRLSKLLPLQKQDFIHKLGKLQALDQFNVQRLLKQLYS